MRTSLLLLAVPAACLLAPATAQTQDVYTFATEAPAAESVPKIAPESALRAMKERLRNLIAAQEGYWLAHGTFTSDVSALGLHVTGSERREKATVAVIFAGGRGWSAVATHSALPNRTCVVFIGDETTLPRLPSTVRAKKKAETPGVPLCDTP
jgi:hypothetical protein